MTDKTKKKPSFFTLRRWNSQNIKNEDGPRVTTPGTPRSEHFIRSAVVSKSNASEAKNNRRMSAGGLKELVQCALCLEVLHNPKMLPCQHTFCLACLSVYVLDSSVFDCPICRTRIQVQGPNYLNELPSNLYIDSLLALVGVKPVEALTTPPTPTGVQSVDLFAAGIRCSHCKTMCDVGDVTNCEHCKLKFCAVCWSQHLDDMRIQIGSILKQLESAADRLEHKIEHYKDRCERISEQITTAAEEKINAIIESKESMLKETAALQRNGDMSALALQASLGEARDVAAKAMSATGDAKDNKQVNIFINLHQNAIQLLSDVSKWDTERFIFDKESFRIEVDSATPVDAESDEPVFEGAKLNNPLESEESLIQYYRSRNFVPHYVWRKTSRPCGVGLSPWDNHLYICGMDSHSVLVVERTQAKIITRLSCEEMLCPAQVAFLKSAGEIFVTDKWKHCVHVFSKAGAYLRSFGHKGSRAGMFRSPEGIAADNVNQHVYVVDTGNDRVQILHPDGRFIDHIGVVTKSLPTAQTSSVWENTEVACTELNSPTSVAVTSDRVIILDSGNRRVKIYDKENRGKVTEFGSLGQSKGQFRQPEVLTTDPMGNILVGDSGNSRVQVFKPNGQLVRVFGGLGKFGWISGIHVTKQLDIIVSDTKSHSVHFF